MKKFSKISKSLVSILIAAMILGFSACSSGGDTLEHIENQSSAANTQTAVINPYSFVVKAISNGRDITTEGDVNGVTLFIFDEDYEFIETKEIDKPTVLNRRTIQVAAPNTDKITVVAWAGLTNKKEEVSLLNQNNILSDLCVQLKQNNGQVTTLPSDLFHGQLTIDRASMTRSNNAQTLSIERKVSGLSLITKNIEKKFNSTEGDFYYIVRAATSMIDHNGKVSGDAVEYVLPASVDKNGNVVTDHTAILPSDEITIELYRDDIMVLSSKKSKKTQNLSLEAAGQLMITMDFYNTNFSVLAADFGVVMQVVDVA